jgi:hypothetical protein
MTRIGLLALGVGLLSSSVVGGPAEACMPADGHRSAEVAFTDGETIVLEAVTALGQEGEEYRIEHIDGGLPVMVYRAHREPRAMVKLGSGPVEGEAFAWRSVLVVLPESMESENASFDFAGALRFELVWLTTIGAVTGLDEEGITAATDGLTAGRRYFTAEGTHDGVNCVLPGTCYRCAGAGSFTTLPAGSWGTDTAVEPGDAWGRVKAAAGAPTGRCECGSQ